ncbi:MAG: hypothetical protein BGO69_03495 [Bacteroidetes bacterium 46-16]|nr:MAG: hypothetical protein BGO69_03495 [Bacteroidetes bacterium 46-16]
MCKTDDIIKKGNYTCQCTYVNYDTAIANKEETTDLNDRTREDADYDCSTLDSKYNSQGYSGTCVLH